MSFRWLLCGCLLFELQAAGASGAGDTRFVLVNQFLFSDTNPDSHFAASDLGPRFRSAFTAAFPNRVLQLGPERLLSPDEAAVVVVPRITAARVSHEVVAGSIHNFDASIAGSVSAVDPWTGTALFAATRLVSARVKLGASALAATDADLNAAFQAAFEEWMRACFSELNQKLAVFVLRGGTLVAPADARKAAGGVWPFGLERGIRPGLVLTGASHRAARVACAFDHYSAIVDCADPSRAIAAGETYSVTIAQQPAARREPRVAMTWVGPAPAIEGSSAALLPIDGTLTMFADYLSKNSSLRLLPTPIHDASEQQQFDNMMQDVSRYAGLVEQELMSIHQEALRQIAQENPEFRIVLFAPGSYYGMAAAKGSVEHRYRATIGAAIFARHGDESMPVYGLARVFLRDEHLARVAAAGIRDIDDRSALFTAWRNAAIELAREVLASGMLARTDDSTVIEAAIGSGGQPAWPAGLEPDAHAPLLWLRPAGMIEIESAAKPFYRIEPPSQGYLTEAVLGGEHLKPGDRLRYSRAGPRAELLRFRFDTARGEEPLIDRDILQAIVAGRLAEALHREFVPTNGSGDSGLLDGIPLLRCYVSALAEATAGSGLSYSGQWRMQLLEPGAAQPAAKLGIQVTSQVPAAEASVMSPLDRGGYRLLYFSKALDQLTAALPAEHFDQVLKPHQLTQ